MAACTNPDILRVIYFFKLIVDIVKIIIPIGLIVFGLIDFSKSVISSDEKVQKKSINLFIKRVIFAVLVFAVPWIVNVLMITLGDVFGDEDKVNFTDCLENATADKIDNLEKGMKCWQCNDNSKLYYWGTSGSNNPNCHAGWHETNKDEDDCGLKQCWQCNDNSKLYYWGIFGPTLSNCHAGWHVVNETEKNCE